MTENWTPETASEPFSWTSPNFGKPGHNVHESSSGSWLEGDK